MPSLNCARHIFTNPLCRHAPFFEAFDTALPSMTVSIPSIRKGEIMDLIYLVAIAAFLALMVGMAVGCDRLGGRQ